MGLARRSPDAAVPAAPQSWQDVVAALEPLHQDPRPKRSLAARAGDLVDAVGGLIGFSAKTLRTLPVPPFQTREFIQQTEFIAFVSVLPAMLVSIPFGAVIALQLGNLTKQLGAESFTGAASALATIREASPIVTALLLAGAAGTAICADLGARTIREEIDALEALGISTIQRLVVPRVLGCVVVAMLLNGLVSVVGVVGGYVFNVLVQGGSPGAFVTSFRTIATLQDLLLGEVKAVVFGLLTALIACYRGLTVKGGPRAVGDAVNQSVVIAFAALFVTNFVITSIYLQLGGGQ
ncbi:MlaE family ABC transporter permease [Nocardioides sp. MH1]|uniref:MlaE family ABC transporter permease n=1 Tax=Nocardioides sp. MH1 TaxID=3242490 RepID=UPI003520F75F